MPLYGFLSGMPELKQATIYSIMVWCKVRCTQSLYDMLCSVRNLDEASVSQFTFWAVSCQIQGQVYAFPPCSRWLYCGSSMTGIMGLGGDLCGDLEGIL